MGQSTPTISARRGLPIITPSKATAKKYGSQQFTFHGFRYVEVSGYPGPVSRDTITGVVLHSEMRPTGHFECSDPLLNQLQHNIVWAQKGNFVDIPTDCPQRDERLGWTGDIQVFARTAAFNMEVAGFLTRWMQEVVYAQGEQGNMPPVVPHIELEFTEDGGPAWADAVVIVPWTMYLCYGDQRILEDNYPAMNKFMQFILDASPDYIRCAPEYEGWPGIGDWLSINADTPRDLIGTAFWAYDAGLMAQIAAVLGKDEDADRYRRLLSKVKQAFIDRYLKGSRVPVAVAQPSEIRLRLERNDAISRGNQKSVDYGPIPSQVFNTDLFTPTQTAYVLALHFDLCRRSCGHSPPPSWWPTSSAAICISPPALSARLICCTSLATTGNSTPPMRSCFRKAGLRGSIR